MFKYIFHVISVSIWFETIIDEGVVCNLYLLYVLYVFLYLCMYVFIYLQVNPNFKTYLTMVYYNGLQLWIRSNMYS